MQTNNEIKEWYNKKEILEIYPIGLTTYKKRIKKLKCSKFEGKSRIKTKPLTNSNLKSVNLREIHVTALEELFGKVRKPNLNNRKNVIKWVKHQSWDWIGNIIPSRTHPSELIYKMNYLFNELRKQKRDSITLFYSIEQNKNDKYFHSHFLIKDKSKSLLQSEIVKLLEIVSEKNTSKETRIHIKKYDTEKYGNRGSSYTVKGLRFGYNILN